jgi:hypothetical protein
MLVWSKQHTELQGIENKYGDFDTGVSGTQTSFFQLFFWHFCKVYVTFKNKNN